MIVLTLPVPPSANRMWASRVVTPKGKKPMALTYLTPEAKSYKAGVAAAALKLGICEPLAGRVKVEIWYYPNRPQDWQTRMRKLGPTWDDGVMALDTDNVNKALLDSLKEVCFHDDKWVRQLISQRMEPDEHGARVIVRVTAIEAHQKQEALL